MLRFLINNKTCTTNQVEKHVNNFQSIMHKSCQPNTIKMILKFDKILSSMIIEYFLYMRVVNANVVYKNHITF